MKQVQPFLLGSDINVYGMARAFHEQYGIVSKAYAHFQLAPTRYSRIVDVTIVPDFDELDAFKRYMLELGSSFKTRNPDTVALLIPCGDVYADLLSQCGDELRKYFVYNTLDDALSRRLSYKSSFYRICEEFKLPHPRTATFDREAVARGDYRNLPFGFPVAMKPANSVEWLGIEFEGRKKAFIIDTPEELESLIQKSYKAGYTSEMVIQDFIPGGDDRMRVLNAYVDQHHRVRMMFLGHPLLEDPTPVAVGNYAAILPDYDEEVFRRIAAFLEGIGYEGVANFDMKFDVRDQTYKLFEINLRQGRSSYFVTLNGFNLARYFVDDLVEDSAFDGKTVFGRGDKLWLEIPRSIFRTYVADNSDKQTALSMIKSGNWGSTLEYSKDMNPLRWLLIRHMFNIYKKGYSRYFIKKADKS
ncbi:carboxylate--amine ligase [Bifidobacterium fermentum]|uniref:Carboxylate--amine ligase n=1 Tax=Bifidobacterium fermentum TaxID=3059035 RepID=A0AB39UKX1_9BIFI